MQVIMENDTCICWSSRGSNEVFKEEITQPKEPFTRQARDIISINKHMSTVFKGTQQGNLDHYKESPGLALKRWGEAMWSGTILIPYYRIKNKEIWASNKVIHLTIARGVHHRVVKGNITSRFHKNKFTYIYYPSQMELWLEGVTYINSQTVEEFTIFCVGSNSLER